MYGTVRVDLHTSINTVWEEIIKMILVRTLCVVTPDASSGDMRSMRQISHDIVLAGM